MTFNLTDAIQVILIAAVASVVLSYGMYWTLSKAKKPEFSSKNSQNP